MIYLAQLQDLVLQTNEWNQRYSILFSIVFNQSFGQKIDYSMVLEEANSCLRGLDELIDNTANHLKIYSSSLSQESEGGRVAYALLDFQSARRACVVKFTSITKKLKNKADGKVFEYSMKAYKMEQSELEELENEAVHIGENLNVLIEKWNNNPFSVSNKETNQQAMAFRCPHCGKGLPRDSKFCQFCGMKIERLQNNGKQMSEEITYPQVEQEGHNTSTISVDWYVKYGEGYNKSDKLHVGSNLIAVRTGETVRFEVFNQIPKTSWVNASNAQCRVKWGSWIDNNRILIEITGVQAGTSELIFSIGPDKNERSEVFRVFVIILD